MNIVQITADSLSLSSGLPLESFAKTNLSDLLTKKNKLIHIEKTSVSITDYFFSGTKTDENGIALFVGNPVKGETLSDILAHSAHERTAKEMFALTAFTRSVAFLLRHDEAISAVGAGGILIDADEHASTADILYIDSELFDICAQNHKAHYADLQGKYLYKGLDAHASLAFTRAVVAYKALTNHVPFENEDMTKRQEDILDENFIPIALWNPDCDKTLAESIESALRLKQKQEILVGKRTISDAKAEQKRHGLLETAESFDAQQFKKELERTADAKTDFSARSQERTQFITKMRRILAIKRFVRRNKNRILTALLAIGVVLWFVSGVLRSNAQLVTTIGLDSTQTTAVMYTMIHEANVPNLQEILSGKDTKDVLIRMSSMYVSAKQRLGTSPDNGTRTPAQWFFYKKSSKNWMFGISHLTIDGIPFHAENPYHIKKEKPASLKEENGTTLQKGDEATHTAEYYFIRQQENRFVIDKMTDVVTLQWNGKQWKVIKINGKTKSESIKAKDFIEEYHELLGDAFDTIEEITVTDDADAQKAHEEIRNAPSKIREAIETLREKYDWIPTEADFIDAANELLEKYGSIEAEKFLK